MSEAHCGYTSFHKYVITILLFLNLEKSEIFSNFSCPRWRQFFKRFEYYWQGTFEKNLQNPSKIILTDSAKMSSSFGLVMLCKSWCKKSHTAKLLKWLLFILTSFWVILHLKSDQSLLHSSEIFSLCQDRLSGNASKLGTALLCSSRVGSLYDTPNVVAIYYYVWKQQYIFHLEAYLIGSSGVWTHDLSIMMRTCCHISYHASVKIGIIDAHYQTQVEQ